MALTECKKCKEEISEWATKCPKCGDRQILATFIRFMFVYLPLLWVMLTAVALMLGSQQAYDNGASVTTREPSPKEDAIKNAALDYTWTKAGFDNIMEANFTVSNNSNHTIKDIEITCTHFAKSGTMIDSNIEVIYDVVPANGKRTFKNFNMGFIHTQAVKNRCSITDLVIE